VEEPADLTPGIMTPTAVGGKQDFDSAIDTSVLDRRALLRGPKAVDHCEQFPGGHLDELVGITRRALQMKAIHGSQNSTHWNQV
jgi:hypothetical protein